MKIRYSFVANSSSSSFVVAVREGHEGDIDSIVGSAGWMEQIAREIVGFAVKHAEFNSMQDWIDNHCEREYYDSDELFLEDFGFEKRELEKHIPVDEDGWLFGFGHASYNEFDGLAEMIVGNMMLNLRSDNFILVSGLC